VHPNFIDYTGLTVCGHRVMGQAETRDGRAYWKFYCGRCGNAEFIAKAPDVKRGKVKSCGCLNRERVRSTVWREQASRIGRLNRTHGMTN
jgi:hypothetical protein